MTFLFILMYTTSCKKFGTHPSNTLNKGYNTFISATETEDINFVNMYTQLIKTRRKVDCNIKKGQGKCSLEDIFEIPTENCKVKRKIDEHRMGFKQLKRETHLTVGKTSLLLSVLKNNKTKIFSKYCDHSLLSYNF